MPEIPSDAVIVSCFRLQLSCNARFKCQRHPLIFDNVLESFNSNRPLCPGIHVVSEREIAHGTHINAFGDTHINAFGDTQINAFGDTRINAFGVWGGATPDTHINAFGA